MKTPQGTLFVVDDDPRSRRAAAALALSMKIRCETFASGEEFLNRHDHLLTGCVLLDFRLGGMDGLAVQDRLRAMGSALSLVLISAYADARLAARAMAGGAVAVVEKPYQNDDLADALRKALDRSARTQQSPADEAGPDPEAMCLAQDPAQTTKDPKGQYPGAGI